MKSSAKRCPEIQALIAAALFGAGAPIAKLLLNQIEPIFLAGLLYLGSGVGLLLTKFVLHAIRENPDVEAPMAKSDIARVLGAMVTGGIAAPIVLMFGLRHTPAATTSLLLNFEVVATVLIAGIIFREAIGRRVWIAVAGITVAGSILSIDVNAAWGISIGVLGVLAACILWGVDNNITNTISAKDPLSIVTIKALGAGIFSITLAFALNTPLPTQVAAIKAMTVGYFTYGLSIVLFILSMRGLGAARAGTLFGVAPFIGAVLSFLIFSNLPDLRFLVALPIMIAGAALLLGEAHSHEHLHCGLDHEHRHTHDDEHHNHSHSQNGKCHSHSHPHFHNEIRHNHPHTPDLHHRHGHGK